jgi:hypothetical protein
LVYGCLRGGARKTLRRKPFTSTGLDSLRLAGTFAVWADGGGCAFGPCYKAWRADLRRGQLAGTFPGFGKLPSRLAVTPNGGAVWVQRTVVGEELRKLDNDGAERVAFGARIEDLRLTRSAVEWRTDGLVGRFVFDRHPPCSVYGSSTAVKTDLARAYYFQGRTFGCLLESGRRRVLGPTPYDFEYGGVNHLRLAGPYVGFDAGHAGRSGSGIVLRVIDLRDGETIREWVQKEATVLDVELTADGALGWGDVTFASPGAYEIRKADREGSGIVLDIVSRDEASDVRLDGNTLSWRHGGEVRTAELRG